MRRFCIRALPEHSVPGERNSIPMLVTVNGKPKEYPGPMTLAGLLENLGINPKSAVVEKNLQIVDRKRLDVETIADGDTIEIIRFVGGG
jgi:thiamine biosynthesis protein ThiS